MPPRKQRKTATANASAPVAPEPRAATGKAETKRPDKIGLLFDAYANKSMGMIDPEGVEALCLDVGVDYTDVKILMLAWKMEAQKQGYFTKEEWERGLKALKADSLPKLKKALPGLETEVNTPPNFADFYSYAFQYCLTEEKQKSVDVETICQLLDMVLGPMFPSQIQMFTKYLNEQNDYRAINRDQWVNFLRFFNEISFPDLNNYDSTEAWPLVLDGFVDWVKEKQN